MMRAIRRSFATPERHTGFRVFFRAGLSTMDDFATPAATSPRKARSADERQGFA